jgi:endonuclease/exonuclease/phosphatase family metal-dependent hydrolase
MNTIRIGTFNVRGVWGQGQAAIAQLLVKAGVDLVCFQECWLSTVTPIQAAMGPQWKISVEPEDDTSNVILSRVPFDHVETIPIELDGPYELRSAVIGVLQWPGFGPLTVCNTHLEQGDESARLAQWEMIRAHLGEDAIVCGDLNALRRADYTDDQWMAMARHRAESQWPAPESRLMERLAEDGFRDGWLEAGTGKMEGTCSYQTRIDYVLLGPRFSGSFLPASYCLAPTMANNLSDHSLVLVEVALDPNGGDG